MNDDREKFEIALPKEVKNDSGYISVFYTDDEYEIAFEGWQARGEHDRKELEELRTRLSGKTCFVPPEFTAELEETNKQRLEVHRLLSAETAAKFTAIKELEAANQRIRELEGLNLLCSSGEDSARKSIGLLQEEIDALEKKLAEQQAQIKHACWLQMERDIHRYLSANAKGRENGALKATCHIQLCSVLIAVFRGETFFDTELVIHPEFRAVREATQALTGYLDEVIGFPLDNVPDYDALAPMFFDKFYELGAAALGCRTEELTKLLTAARKEGFEEGKQGMFTPEDVHELQNLAREDGKQAGRDAIWKEALEHAANVAIAEGQHANHYGIAKVLREQALIPRPLPPQVKGE